MFAFHPTNGSFVVDATDPLNRFHETALREARIASDYRHAESACTPHASFVRRIRSALAGSPTTGADCGCAA
jgi:hypothetical protein